MSFVNRHKRLLLDGRVVERAEQARLVIGPVVKEPRSPFFGEDKPWEVRYDNLYANLHHDLTDGRFKCWYNIFIIDPAESETPPEARATTRYQPHDREMGVCYAESADGIAWTKPDLGLIEFDGTTQNNLVLRDVHGVGITFDPHDPDPARRYKAFLPNAVATSPDGLRWSAIVPCPEIAARGDTHNIAFWNDAAQEYVGITRLWDGRQRIVGRTVSADYRRWTKAVEVLRALPEESHRQTYALLPLPYADGYLGFLMLLDTTPADTVDCELVWSADTEHWQRICPGVPLIPRGPEGSFDRGCIYAGAWPVLHDGRLRLYYGGSDGPHTNWRKGGFGLAYLRPDGFAGYAPVAKSATATITTRPIECTGATLRISADAAGGQVRVAVVGADGLGLDACEPVTGDVTDGIVRWHGGRTLAALRGQRVRLVFELNGATLYAFSLSD